MTRSTGVRLQWVAAAVLVAHTMMGAVLVAESLDAAVPSQRLLFCHWWTSPSESAAINALVRLFKTTYPDVVVVAQPVAGNLRSLFPTIKLQVGQRKAPDAFQMFAGSAAQIFYDAGLLSPIDELWAEEKLEYAFPPFIRDLNKFDGHYYSIPVNVHRTNVVWYNKALLESHQIDPETLTSWETFFAAADKLKAEGVATPIQMGVTWTAKTVFEGIMASQGIGVYEDWINGKITARDDARLLRAWATFQKYLSYANKDHENVAWDAAVRRVIDGEGAFIIMGDWANGEFRVARMKYGKDYGTFAVPGTKAMFGLGIDTFLHPKGITDQTSSMRWLRLAASREGQDTFNPLKGSISARIDSDVSRYDPYQRTAIADLKSARLMYPSLGSAVPEAFNNHLQQDLAAFMVDEEIDKAAASLADGAKQLTGRYSRQWQLR